jgi:hypothetical protein
MMSIEVLKDIPVASGPGWKLSKTVVGIHENSASMVFLFAGASLH